MQDSSSSARQARRVANQHSAKSDEQDPSSNDQIKELLRTYGLRTSLIRLKVIDALHVAARSGHAIGVRGVHSQLENMDIPLSFLSVREVLKRLCAEGVITLNVDKTYSLDPAAERMLG